MGCRERVYATWKREERASRRDTLRSGSKSVVTVLLIEDSSIDSISVTEMFDNQGPCAFRVTAVNCIEDAEMTLFRHSFDVVLLYPRMHGTQGLEAIRRVHASAPDASIVLLSDQGDERMAEQAMQEGVQDFLIKGHFDPSELKRTLRNSIARKQIEDSRDHIEQSLFIEKERAQLTLDCIGDGVLCTDIEGNITFLNPVAERLIGWALPEANGRPMEDVFRIIDSNSREMLTNPLKKAIELNRIGHLPANPIGSSPGFAGEAAAV